MGRSQFSINSGTFFQRDPERDQKCSWRPMGLYKAVYLKRYRKDKPTSLPSFVPALIPGVANRNGDSRAQSSVIQTASSLSFAIKSVERTRYASERRILEPAVKWAPVSRYYRLADSPLVQILEQNPWSNFKSNPRSSQTICRPCGFCITSNVIISRFEFQQQQQQQQFIRYFQKVHGIT